MKKLKKELETFTSKKLEEEEKNLKEINTIKQKADLRIAAAKVSHLFEFQSIYLLVNILNSTETIRK